jgi:hypothetical protein
MKRRDKVLRLNRLHFVQNRPAVVVLTMRIAPLSFLITLSGMADSQKSRQVEEGHRGSLVLERLVRGRRAVQSSCRNWWFAWRVRAIAMVCKGENAGSFRLGDALERYGESRRSATVQTLRVVGQRRTGMQRP